ncbi:MAG: ABC transporter substrate-binding protein [Gammaproteobacteria bacterium]|nr:ABC transporter substrate-binding protein [Gammaproteobacteria bacterium]
MDKQDNSVSRRSFLAQLGVTVGATSLGTAGYLADPRPAHAAVKPKGNIPDKPIKTGHITFLTGPAEILGGPGLRGHLLAAEEINAEGGLLGKRKIETIQADEAAGTDANVKELRRMKLSEGINLFTGIISSGNTPALGPVAEELGILTLFNDGCTDFLFDRAVPNPKYVFRVTNIQSADGVTAAVGAATAWPDARKIASIQPDYSYGRNVHEHFTLAFERLVPGVEMVSEAWPKLFTTDFTPHITKLLAAEPDLLIVGLWGGDYVAFYKQALRYGLFDKMKVATTLAFGGVPHAIGKDHPETVLAGVHANYHFLFPPGNRWPPNSSFVERYYKRWDEYPSFESEGGYTALYLYKAAVEKANQLAGGWPEDEEIIAMLEGMGMDAPAGYIYIRPDNHQGYKDAVTGLSRNVPEYDFPVWDADSIISIPVRNITAPPNWPKPGKGHEESTAAAHWIKTTWPAPRKA